MEHITWLTVTWLVLGLVTNALLRLKTLRKKKVDFSLGFWLKDNFIVILLSIIAGVFSVRFSDQMISVMDIQVVSRDAAFYEFHAFVSGLTCHSVLSHLEGWYNPKKNG